MIDTIETFFCEHWGNFGEGMFIFFLIIFGLIVGVASLIVLSMLGAWIKKMWDKKVIVGKRAVRVFSVPLVALVTISMGAAVVVREENHDDILALKIVISAIAITLVWSIITCRVKGLWIGPVRVILGFLIFVAIATVIFAILLFAGIVLGLIGGSSSYPEYIRIYQNGSYVTLKHVSDSEYINTSTNERYTYENTAVRDRYGIRYDILN